MSITLKKPAADKGYASKDSGLGKIFSLSVSGSETIHLSNVKSHSKVGATDRKDEVYQINKSYNNSRKYIAKSILKYLIENDGAVDAWPDPDTGLSMGFRMSDDNDEDTRGSYDTYYYNFDYFASDFESNQYGLITGGKRSYRNEYRYEDTQRVRSIRIHENNLLDEFKENNPLYFIWSLLAVFMVFLCFGGPLLSTIYLAVLQRASDPEVVELAVEGFFSHFTVVFALLAKLPKLLQYILSIFLYVPFAITLLLKLIPEMVCAIAGKSVVVLVIYGLLLFVGGFMTFGMLYAFLGEKIPSAKPVHGLICLAEYIKSKCSKERKEAFEENERLKEEYTRLMDDFHHRWYSYVSAHSR